MTRLHFMFDFCEEKMEYIFELNAAHYMAFMQKAAEQIHKNGAYITALDAATGDGDHWANMDSGFTKIIKSAGQLSDLCMADCFRQIGLLFMSGVGGSAGALYGCAYLAAGKQAPAGKESLGYEELFRCLEAALAAIMQRGQSQPGDKTMVDTLYPAVAAYRTAIESKTPLREAFSNIKQAAADGAASTKAMAAVRGRAYYQADKGVGHLDPGAVTMYFQIAALCDYIIETLL